MPDRAGARFADHDAQGKPGCRPVMLPRQARGPIARLLLSGCASGKGRRRGWGVERAAQNRLRECAPDLDCS